MKKGAKLILNTPNIHTLYRSLSWLGTDISIESGGFENN
jgi:hypothetical protein